MKFRQGKRVIRESKRNLKDSFMDEYVPATVNDNLTVEEYFGTLMQSVVETWGLHLNTNKYSEHIALNELYDNLLESVDTLIENYKGIYGNIPAKAEVFKPEATNASEYLRELREFVEKGRNLFTDSELLSDIDSILSQIDETLYKVENLTESRKRSKRIVKESLDIDKEQTIEITDEMKEKYPSLKEYDEIIISGKKINWNDAMEYAKKNKAVLPDIKEGMSIWKIIKNSVCIDRSCAFWTKDYGKYSMAINDRCCILDGEYVDCDKRNMKYAFCLRPNKLNESNKRNRKMMKESYTQRIMDVTDEMKANYPSLKDVTKIRDYGDKFNMKEIKKFKNYFKDWKLPSLKQAMEIASMLSEEYKNSKDKNGIWSGEIWTDRFEVVDIFPTMRDGGMKITPSMNEEYDMWLINK